MTTRGPRPVVIRSPKELADLRRIRQKAERAIDRLLAVLDAIDAPEEDLEPIGDDEPNGDDEGSLGWASSIDQGSGQQWHGQLLGEHDTDREAAGHHSGRPDRSSFIAAPAGKSIRLPNTDKMRTIVEQARLNGFVAAMIKGELWLIEREEFTMLVATGKIDRAAAFQ